MPKATGKNSKKPTENTSKLLETAPPPEAPEVLPVYLVGEVMLQQGDNWIELGSYKDEDRILLSQGQVGFLLNIFGVAGIGFNHNVQFMEGEPNQKVQVRLTVSPIKED